MASSNKKTVLLPIEVPVGAYCWHFKGEIAICEHFDNSSGEHVCKLGFLLSRIKDETDEGYLKPQECADLEIKPEVTDETTG